MFNLGDVFSQVVSTVVGDPTPIGETSVVHANEDGSFSVSDNGEEVGGLTAEQAAQIVIENES